MSDDLAGSNVNRSYSLAGTSIAVFTFMLFFLYPRLLSGEIDALLFQVTLAVMGVATFSFVFASLHYYAASVGARMDAAERGRHTRRGDRFWLTGSTLLFLDPSLVLLSIRLVVVAAVWFALWTVYAAFVIRCFPRILSAPA